MPDEFWTQYAELSAKGNQKELQKLAEKYLPEEVESRVSSSAGKAIPGLQSHEVQFTSVAKRAYRKVRSNHLLIKKVNEFMEVARGGFDNVKKAAKKRKWNLEPIKEWQDQGGYAVRMSGGFRIGFRRLEDGSVEVLKMGNKIYDHGT